MLFCLSKIALIPVNEVPLLWGDFNWHVERYTNGYENIHGNQGFGTRKVEGFCFLDLCTAVNTSFKTRDTQLISSKSSSSAAQLDYILTKRSALRSVRDVKVIQHEECITQHKHLIRNKIIA